jgi:serine/threonine-protein kinase
MTERAFDQFGSYTLLDQIGRGGMSRVDVAVADATGELVVLKRLKVGADPELAATLEREAQLGAFLVHPNLVRTLGTAQRGGERALVLEYVDGHSLAELMREHRARGAYMPPNIALRIVRDVLLALSWAHAARGPDGKPLGLVHRDVSPHNIMVSREGKVKLLDFGIAKIAAACQETTFGTFKGKVGYVAPEQIQPGCTVDGRTDIFAVGIVLWELLTGKRYCAGSTWSEQLTARFEKPPVPVREAAPWIDAALATIVEDAVAEDPQDRFASAVEMCFAVERYATDHGPLASDAELARQMSLILGLHAHDRRLRVRARLNAFLAQAPSVHPWDLEAPTVMTSLPPSEAPLEIDVTLDAQLPALHALRRTYHEMVAVAGLFALVLTGVGVGVARHSGPSASSASPAAPAAKAASATLSFVTDPPMAVIIDGVARGTTPLSALPLAPGPHRLKAAPLDGGSALVEDFTLRAGEQAKRTWIAE